MAQIKKAVRFIQEARKAATFETASFHFDNEEKNKETKEATRIYRESWILPQLDHALRLLEPGKHTAECGYCWEVH